MRIPGPLLLITVAVLLAARPAAAQYDAELRAFIDSIHQTFEWRTGQVALGPGLAVLDVPPGFKYLDPEQSAFVLSGLWGNPPDSSTLGMLFPQGLNPLDSSSWAFNIQYSPLGYVKDSDADEIDYAQLLADMQADANASNAAREAEGYERVELIGWASEPYYDAQAHVLHWAKDIRFGSSEAHTLNYNIRILGRKGVLVINAIADMGQLAEVKGHVPAIQAAVQFNEGYRYDDFDPKLDEVAAVTIGGLVAGKVLAKAGFFALLAKFWKLIAAGAVVAAGAIYRLIRRKPAAPPEAGSTPPEA